MTAATFEDHPTDPTKVILRKKPHLDKGRDYEEGFVDGMQHQMQSSVDKAVNAMAQPEPVRIMGFDCVCGRRMVVSAEQGVVPAPQRKPLTDEEVESLYENTESVNWARSFARAIEAAHGIKENT